MATDLETLMNSSCDDAYKFAYILTLNEDGAKKLFSDSFASLCKRYDPNGDAERGRSLWFAQIYKTALKSKTVAAADAALIKNPDTRQKLLEMTLCERAASFLEFYLDMNEEEIRKIIK